MPLGMGNDHRICDTLRTQIAAMKWLAATASGADQFEEPAPLLRSPANARRLLVAIQLLESVGADGAALD
jgi:hypothetical protein